MTQYDLTQPNKPLDQDPIGQHLLDQGVITQDMLTSSLKEQTITKEKLSQVLLKNGFISQKQKIEALRVVDIDRLADESTMLTRCPTSALIDTQTMILIEDKGEVYLASRQRHEDVEKRLRPYYPNFAFRWSSVDTERLDSYLNRLENFRSAKGAQIDKILREGFILGASDIHIEPKNQSFSVFLRIDGVKRHYIEGEIDEYRKTVQKIKDLANLDTSERRIPMDGGFQVEHQGRYIDLRVATTPSVEGEKVVIRILDPSNNEVDIHRIGITRLEQWLQGVHELSGLCLICGPTGSGKTTTLNATAKDVNRFSKAVYTIEDPVEYRVPYITQINVNRLVGLDFARALKSLLRLDPDIIIVGEIRDLETAENAMKLAETGHLVIGTMHTESIIGALGRLRDIGINIRDIRHLVRSIMVQRLVRKFCSDCHGDGCPTCEGTGMKGRSLISEVNYFNNGDEVLTAYEGESWWPSLIDDALIKFDQKLIPREEIQNLGTASEQALAEWEAKGGGNGQDL